MTLWRLEKRIGFGGDGQFDRIATELQQAGKQLRFYAAGLNYPTKIANIVASWFQRHGRSFALWSRVLGSGGGRSLLGAMLTSVAMAESNSGLGICAHNCQHQASC